MMSYCERTTEAFWAEPANALSNLVFVLAAILIARQLKTRDLSLGRSWEIGLLALLAATIGIGSFLWHTLASPWTMLADIVPIMIFISVFMLSFLVRVAGMGKSVAFALFVVFLLINYLFARALPPDTLNGSIFYLPTWLALWLMALHPRTRAADLARAMMFLGLVFTVSLVMRSTDQALCPSIPTGTHFAWHLLNGYLIYGAMRILVLAASRDLPDHSRTTI